MMRMTKNREKDGRLSTDALVDYVREGTELIQDGSNHEAQQHFTDATRWANRVRVVQRSVGQFRLVEKLASQDDLVDVTRFLAGNSSSHEGGRKSLGDIVIANYAISTISREKSDDSGSPLIDLNLAGALEEEASLIAAEEWLHLIQRNTGESLAGIQLKEADVAAYLDGLGIDLSVDHATRYPERATWYVWRYPERESEVMAFSERYSLRYGPDERFIQAVTV